MKKGNSKLERQLNDLAALKGEPLVAETRKAVRSALCSSSNHVVAAAVNLIGEDGDPDWRYEVEEVFDRFMEDPVKQDPGCTAKQAAVQALNKMECDAAGVFIRAVKHVQLEPVFGGSQDTAASMRGFALGGLIAMGHPQSLFHAAPLLVDKQAETRYLAADATGYAGTESAELMLRMKVHAGDEDARVTGACFTSLIRLDPERSLYFVAEFLNHYNTEIRDAAALALGESRHEEACELLCDCWHNTLDNGFREYLILPISLLRNEASNAFLLELIGHGNVRYARAALEGLAILKHDQDLVRRLQRALTATGNRDLQNAFKRLFL